MARRNNDDIENFHLYGLYIPTRTIQYPSPTGDCDIDQAGVNKTIANFHILESLSIAPITLLLNSYGGDVFQALGLYDYIKTLQSEVTIKAVGACMSGATIILQAGDKRLISANTTFMMHVGSSALDDHSNNVRNWVKYENDTIVPKMKEVYAEKMIKLPKESPSSLNKRLDKLLDFDTILTASEVIKLGLADDLY